MSKVKIGYYIDTTSIGGTDLYFRQLIENIDKTRYEVVFFCKKEYPIRKVFKYELDFRVNHLDNKRELKESGHFKTKIKSKRDSCIKLLRFFWHKTPFTISLKLIFGSIKDIIKMSNIFRKYNLDIFHGCFGSAIIAAHLANIPVVVAFYGIMPNPSGVKHPSDIIRQILELVTVRSLTRAITLAQTVKDAWMKRLKVSSDKFEIIPNGVDLSIFDNGRHDIVRVRDEIEIGADRTIVGVSARLHPMKGHKYLIQAMPEIIRNIPNIKFLFVGDGTMKAELIDMVRNMKLDSYVKFLGFRADLHKLTWMYDISVLPSVYEGLPYVILEAMACSKPVVASNIGGIPKVVEDGVTGILVTPRDSDALAKAIIELLKDKNKARKMGEAGRKRVEKYFTQDVMLKKTYELYERFLNERQNKYKVAVLSSGLGHVRRGIETWAEDLAGALKKKGVEATLYGGHRSPDTRSPDTRSPEARSPGYRVISCIRRDSRFSGMLIKIMPSFSWHFGCGSGYQLEQTTFVLNLLPELMQKRFDIIHTQDPVVANILRMAKKMRLIRSRVILAHGTEERFDFIKKFSYLQHLAPYHMEEAMQCGVNGTRHFAIPNFVDTERFASFQSAQNAKRKTQNAKRRTQDAGRTKLKIPKDAFVVLSVAAIKRRHKRIDYLIDEVSRFGSRLACLRQTRSNSIGGVYLVIAGSGTDETEELIEYGKRKLGDRVVFLTDFPRERMHEVYSAADVFTLCSLKEMMPIALLEALSSGVPSIVNKHPVVEWMVGEGGESIDMREEGELARSIERYMDEGYRRQKGIKAREQAVRNFSKEIVVDKIIEMYGEVFIASCVMRDA